MPWLKRSGNCDCHRRLNKGCIEGTYPDRWNAFAHCGHLGLRENPDEVEQIGIQKAKQEWIPLTGCYYWWIPLTEPRSEVKLVCQSLWVPFRLLSKITVVRNKIDCTQEESGLDESNSVPVLRISVQGGARRGHTSPTSEAHYGLC